MDLVDWRRIVISIEREKEGEREGERERELRNLCYLYRIERTK